VPKKELDNESMPTEAETGEKICEMSLLLEITVFEKGTVIDAQVLPEKDREVFDGVTMVAIPKQPRDFVRDVMVTIEKVMVGIFCANGAVQHPPAKGEM
jgi:hypothetical protein